MFVQTGDKQTLLPATWVRLVFPYNTYPSSPTVCVTVDHPYPYPSPRPLRGLHLPTQWGHLRLVPSALAPAYIKSCHLCCCHCYQQSPSCASLNCLETYLYFTVGLVFNMLNSIQRASRNACNGHSLSNTVITWQLLRLSHCVIPPNCLVPHCYRMINEVCTEICLQISSLHIKVLVLLPSISTSQAPLQNGVL